MSRREQSTSSEDINASDTSEKPSGISHSFDTGISRACGLESAVIYNHICFWIAENKYRNEHFIDGRTWMYQSRADIAGRLDYLTIDQVRRALERLVDKGFLITGKFHQNKFKHDLWYALPDESILKPKRNSNKQYDTANLPKQGGKSAKTIQISNNTDLLSYVSKDTPDKSILAPSSPMLAQEIKEKIIFSPELTHADVLAGEGKVIIPVDKWDEFVKRYGEERVLKSAHELSEGIACKNYKYKKHYVALGNWIKKDIENQAKGRVKDFKPAKSSFRRDYTGAGSLPVDHVELKFD